LNLNLNIVTLRVFVNILAICVGACCGALLRWGVGIWLNTKSISLATLPLGTILVNLAGAWLIGIGLIFFEFFPQIDPAWRLAIITGFLGALTTFSTFSSEVVGMAIEGRYGWALLTGGLHLFGSLILTVVGMYSGKLLLRLFFSLH
jgi:fluoride exporter